ncbi:hypothetical protein J1614_000831 [Plenodomus biglobosus]|nr:hypothetical protein J1614_000831 [Plenodomus biglobosus]
MPSQAEEVQNITAELMAQPQAPANADRISSMMRRIYNPNLIGERHFYHRIKIGYPILIKSTPDSLTALPTIPTLTPSTTLSPSTWVRKQRSNLFHGPTWPPKHPSDILTSSASEPCLSCQRETPCPCTYPAWQTAMHNLWTQTLTLQAMWSKCTGIIALGAIPNDTIIVPVQDPHWRSDGARQEGVCAC